ncbi:MAG: ABC transporter permease [Verrucomicrobia bacterium]|nr:ABC transporter permease [Verrucomicrobiota bacterium]
MKFLHLTWSNLKRKKLRTVLTLMSVLVAFLLYGLLCAIKEALTAGVSMAGADRLIVRHKISIIQLLPQSYEARMERVPGVAAAVHQTWFGGIYQDAKNFFPVMPVNPDEFLEMYPEYGLEPSEIEAWKKTRTGAIVGRTTADRFKWKVGDRVPLFSPIWGGAGTQPNWEFDVVGIFEAGKRSTDTTQFFFRYDFFDEARREGKGQVGWYTLRIKDPNQAAEVARKVDEEFANSPAETKTEPEGVFAQGFASQIGNIGAILIAVVSAVYFTILLVAGNTMAQAVRERTEEIGVLKAMGFTNTLVMGLVLAESFLIASGGGLLGLGLAWLATSGGNPAPGLLPVFYIPGRDMVIGVALAVGLGLVAGLAPAWQAMRLEIATALRRGA